MFTDCIDAYQRGGRLTITDSQPRYSGQYVCTVYFVNGDRRTEYASLVVETVQPPGLTTTHGLQEYRQDIGQSKC